MLKSNNILKLVDVQTYHESEIDLLDASSLSYHSLHKLHPSLTKLSPSIASYFIKKYSKKDDVVLDPFCGFGTNALESLLNGRVALASDIDKLSLCITKAKINPITFPELALSLQLIDTKRLVRLGDYERYFAPFYDIDTYKEILSIRDYIQSAKSSSDDDTSYFIEALMLGVLHGPNASFLSTPTYQDVSISPEKQHKINVEHRLSTDYKAVIPKLLKQASSVFVDHIPSAVHDLKRDSKCYLQDARNLNKISGSSVDLILTEPPMFYDSEYSGKLWLKNWFCNNLSKPSEYDFFDEDSWLDFMNEALMEFHRVLKPNKKIVLILRDNYNTRVLNTHEALCKLINDGLSRYFTPEKCLIQTQNKNINQQYKYLVIRKL